MKTWSCKIGETDQLPDRKHIVTSVAYLAVSPDEYMRRAVTKAYKELTRELPAFIFSGWGAELDERERAVVEDRMPDPAQTFTPKDAQTLLDYVRGDSHMASASDLDDAVAALEVIAGRA